MAAVAGASRAVVAAGAAVRVEVAAAEEATVAPVVPAVVATVVVAGLLVAVGTTKESELIAKCARYSGFGHEKSTCSSDAAVLAVELRITEVDLAVEAQAFVVKETGKDRVMVEEEVGSGELGKQVVQYIADSVAVCNMTPGAVGLTNYRECSRPLDRANWATTSIAGYGDLTVAFRSGNGWMHVKRHDVVHTPLLSYNLISLPSLALKGHMCAGDKDGVTLKLKGGETVHYPLGWKALPPVRVPPRGEVWGGRHCLCRNCSWASESSHHPHGHQHLPLHLRPYTRGAAQENGGAARSQP